MEAAVEENDKPLRNLFQRLIGSKQCTVLTNAQIADILEKEFAVDISNMHELEKQIYLILMKKFLKDWPLWDNLDRTVQTLKTGKDFKIANKKSNGINKREQMELGAYCENLKAYLSEMLETAKPLIKEAGDEVKAIANKENPKANERKVVLEVKCTRKQLNGLFYRQAHPEYNHTIFNPEPLPPIIKTCPHSFKSVMNWPHVSVTVNVSQIVFTREMSYVTKRRLVNKKRDDWRAAEPKELDTRLQMKASNAQTAGASGKRYTLQDFFDFLNRDKSFARGTEPALASLIEVLKNDLACGVQLGAMPINPKQLNQFRRGLSKYPYVRYLYSDVETKQGSASKPAHDLQLEETFVPQMSFGIIRFPMRPLTCGNYWFRVKCLECNRNIRGADFRTHFETCHQNEKNWVCTNCEQSFEMVQLCESGWKHECPAVDVAAQSS